MSTNKRKNLLMLALVFCCCLLSAGYFSLISKSVVEGRVKFEQGTWNVKFTDIKTNKALGNAINYENPKLSNYVVSFYALFKEVGDSISYDVEVTNAGNLDAKLSNISFISRMSDSVDFEYDGIEIGNILKPGESKKFRITVSYSRETGRIEKSDSQMKLLLNWIQA